jgi:hypothetical protein
MKKISELLEKFQALGVKEGKLKEKILKILKEDFDVEVTKKHLDIKNKILTLKFSGPQKTNIILGKRKILEQLEGEIIDIR